MARLRGLIAHLPRVCRNLSHPATCPYLCSAPGYGYVRELEALTDPRMPGLLAAGDIRVGGYGDFPVQ